MATGPGRRASTGTIGLTAPVATEPVPSPGSRPANGPTTAAARHSASCRRRAGRCRVARDRCVSAPYRRRRRHRLRRCRRRAAPARRPRVATVGSTGGVTALIRSPLVRRMLELVLAEPVLLSAGRALSPRPLSGLPLERLAPPRPVPAPASGSSQCRSWPVAPGPDLRDPGRRQRRGHPRCGHAPGPADRGPPCPLADRRGQVPGLPRHPGQTQAVSPDPQGHRPGQHVCPEAHDRRQGRAQPRLDAAAAGGPAT